MDASAAAAKATVVGTRIHWNNRAHDDLSPIPVERVLQQTRAFWERAATYADGIVIAVGLPQQAATQLHAAQADDLFLASVRDFLTRLQHETCNGVAVESASKDSNATTTRSRTVPVVVLPMLHWGSFVPAINAIISCAATQFPRASLLLLQSLEIEVDAAGVAFLKTHFELGTDLVVGAALPGHSFMPTSDELIELNGLTTPWNTLALWDLARLARVGFPLIGDGLKIDGATSCAGVEEVTTIAMYQQLYPSASRAQVIQVPGIAWQVDNFESEERRIWQDKKMASKLQRAETQMTHFHVAPGKVYHKQTKPGA
uniref:Uncharacterized protein n=1 Tax=Globisporangium ultimum (strain ATCC 200006 / CBS 805.95 / DAOM BR144) TaxID=431595 RepID=K3WG91_GLOUD